MALPFIIAVCCCLFVLAPIVKAMHDALSKPLDRLIDKYSPTPYREFIPPGETDEQKLESLSNAGPTNPASPFFIYPKLGREQSRGIIPDVDIEELTEEEETALRVARVKARMLRAETLRAEMDNELALEVSNLNS